MADRLTEISAFVGKLADVVITAPFTEKDGSVRGAVSVTVEEYTEVFDVLIQSPYPQQFHEAETIMFTNKGLIKFNHVNWDGSICIHTLHSPDLFQKLDLDFRALKAWMLKYLVNKDVDSHYEHIIVPCKLIDGKRSVMLFTDVDHTFKAGDFGPIQFSMLQEGKVKDQITLTYILQSFKAGKKDIHCKWSDFYQAMNKYAGIYLFMDKAPVSNGRFALENWQDLLGYLPDKFLDYLEDIEHRISRENYSDLKLVLGYPVSNTEIHWEVVSIEKNKYPNHKMRIKGTRYFPWTLKDQPILWGETKNSGYTYFFGRGALSENLTNKKILLLGLGAIGSMVATTLCRGGCKDFTLVDYEAKEPGNVCRSEYQFYTGINNKVDELQKLMLSISPFVSVRGEAKIADGFKLLLNAPDYKSEMKTYLNGFDLIIDCTADNDLAWLLSQMDIEKEMINLSITNYAKELVCVSGANLYHNLIHIFGILNNEDAHDMYNPIGCWNPTFKAGYNDIAVMVQFAIKQINLSYKAQQPLRNFFLSSDEEDGFKIKITQF